ncbi:MAG: hypothetical protein GY710_03580, partial [Desulfobacteraceae bacterium]|nr:hypothetical protein [Desulfobacteraceae bacterium]
AIVSTINILLTSMIFVMKGLYQGGQFSTLFFLKRGHYCTLFNIVLRHRAEIKALLELEEAFLIELGGKPQKGQFASFKGKISSVDVDLTVSEKAKTLKDLAGVRAQRIALERQAFNIKDDTEPDDGKQEDNKWIFEAVKVVRHADDADT